MWRMDRKCRQWAIAVAVQVGFPLFLALAEPPAEVLKEKAGDNAKGQVGEPVKAKPAITRPTPKVQAGQEAAPKAAESASSADGPQISFDSITFDFGVIDEGALARHEFIFENVGTQPLKIIKVAASCGCTTLGDWDRVVEPGKSGKIPIQFNSMHRAGQVHKAVIVNTNVPGQTQLMLWVKGTVHRPINVDPSFIHFEAIPNAEGPLSKTVKIINQEPEPLEIKAVKSDNPAFKTEIKTLKPGKEFALEVTIVPQKDRNVAQGMITLVTSCSKKPVITIPTNYRVPPPIEVIPQKLILPSGSLSKPLKMSVHIKNNTSTLLEISEVTVNAENAKVETLEEETGKRYRIALDFPAGFSVPEEGEAMLTFKTNDASAAEVKIPITQRRPSSRSPVKGQKQESTKKEE